MAKAKTTAKVDAAGAVSRGAIDRVAMPSLAKDGSYDQTDDFEIVGDKDSLLVAEKERQRQLHVSAVDQELRGAFTGPGILAEDAEEDGTAVQGKQDPSIEKLEKEHEAAEKAGEKAAEELIDSHFKEDK